MTSHYNYLTIFLLAFVLLTGGLFLFDTSSAQAAGAYTWKEQTDSGDPTGKNWRDADISTDGQYVVATDGASVWFSSNGGDSWSQKQENLSNLQQVEVTNNGEVFVARAGGVYQLTDTGEVSLWSNNRNYDTNYLEFHVSSDGQYISLSGPFSYDNGAGYAVDVSNDGGATWSYEGTGGQR